MRVRDFLQNLEQQLQDEFRDRDDKITAVVCTLLQKRWVVRALKGLFNVFF